MTMLSPALSPESLARLLSLLARIPVEPPSDVIAEAEALARSPDTEVEGTFLLALVAIRSQDISSAISLLEQCLKLRPTMREAAEALGVAYALAAQMTDSIYYAKLALTLDWHAQIDNLWPESFGTLGEHFYNVQADPQFREGIRLFNGGAWQRALHLFRQVLAINPDRQDVSHLIVTCHLALKNWSEALSELDALAAAGRMAPRDWRLRAQLDLALGRGCEALTAIRRATRLDTEDRALRAEAVAMLSAVHPALTAHFSDLIPKRRPVQTPRAVDGQTPRIGVLLPNLGRFGSLVGLSDLLAALKSGGAVVHAYLDQDAEDARSHVLGRSGAEVRAIGLINDEALAMTLEGDEIDALLDMTLPGQPRRLVALAEHVPAMQIAWTASDEAMASDLFDLVVVDDRLRPLYGERAGWIYLPTRLDPRMIDAPPTPTAEGAEPRLGCTIGLALAPGDMIADRVEALAECLRAVPDSRLFLLDRGYADLVAMSDLYAAFARYGLGERIALPDFAALDGDGWDASAHKLDLLVVASALGAEQWGWRARSRDLPLAILADPTRPLSAGAALALSPAQAEAAIVFDTGALVARVEAIMAAPSVTRDAPPPADIDSMTVCAQGLLDAIRTHLPVAA